MQTRKCVPAYFWSGDDDTWRRFVASLNIGDIAVVTGPNSGPPIDRADRAALDVWLALLRLRGATVLGYTHLTWGHRPIDLVAEDCAQWRRVGVDGVWLDETPEFPTKAALDTIHGPVRLWKPHVSTGRTKGITAWNPGLWVPTLDRVMAKLPGSLWCTIECTQSRYSTLAAAPRSSTPAREIHLVHHCASDAAALAVERSMRVGYGYATADGADGNPWDSFRV